MSSQRSVLAQRRGALIDRADQHRAALAATVSGLEREIAVADALVATARRVHRHRILVGVLTAGMVLAPVAALKWLRRAVGLAPLVLEGYRLVRVLGGARRAPPGSPPA